MNKNYVKGRKKEYKICNELKKEGFDIAQRTAGSHSPIDIIAIRKKRKEIKLIQAKPNNFSEKEYKKLMKKYGWMTGYFKTEFMVK